MMMQSRDLKQQDPEVYDALIGEQKREREGIELIPSENYVSSAVLEALGSVFTNKYAEGYPGRRYYGGNKYMDIVENLARERAKKLFKCEHANVQPLSGSPMNTAVYLALLKPGDTIMGMDLSHGGHLSHGHPITHTGRLFNWVRYKTHPEEKGRIDFGGIAKLAKKHKPKIILCGYTSYPRDLDYGAFKKVADMVGAITMADVSHIGGLIAGGVMKNPFDYGFDIVTTTTHKTLRGPRGGMILCKNEFADMIDKSVFPGLQGGPHMNNIAGIAVALGEAMQGDFKEYAKQVVLNAKALAKELIDAGAELITGGTDNHMMVVNTILSFKIDGTAAENVLEQANITVNKQIVPDDPNPPLKPSGIRLGTPAATTRGMKQKDMQKLGQWIAGVLNNYNDRTFIKKLGAEVKELCSKFPLPGI